MSTVKLKDIRRDGGTQMRQRLSEVAVVTYADHMQDGVTFPPVVVFHDGTDYWLADGFHRCAAYTEAKIEDVPADVRSGTRLDAIKYAIGANDANGKPREAADMAIAYKAGVDNGLCDKTDTQAVKALLKCSSRWASHLTKPARDVEKAKRDAEIERLANEGKSQREIAKAVGVTQPTVGSVIGDKKKKASKTYHPTPKKAEVDPLAEAQKKEEGAMAERIKKHARQAKQAKIDERRKMLDEQVKDIEEGGVTPPEGKFDVIAIDPPWNYGREYDPETSRVANPYPEMNQEQLLALDLPAKDDCVLFLWTTHQFIFDAKELMDSWGFTYKATMVWNKEKIGMGAWLRMQCEFCLVGIKGKPFWENTRYRDIISEPRREHSRKPDAFFDMVSEITAGRRLEYFSREKREGWEVFGNDVEKF